MTLTQRQLCTVLGILMVVLFVASIAVGRDPLPLLTAVKDVFSGNDSVYAVIVSQIRLPRALIALFAGATLGLCGAAMQGLLRNPLASPGLIGSASGAALFAVFVSVSYTHLTLPTTPYV